MPEPELPREIELGREGPGRPRATSACSARLGYLKLANRGGRTEFDSATDAAVRAYQRRQGLEVDGQIGPEHLRSLLPSYRALGAVARFAVDPRSIRVVPPQDRRLRVRRVPEQGGAPLHPGRTAHGGGPDGIRPPKHPAWEDCSSFATWCYWAAGGPDPNGLDYNGRATQARRCNTARRPTSRGPATWSSTAAARFLARRRLRREREGRQPRLRAGPVSRIDYRSDRSQVRSYAASDGEVAAAGFAPPTRPSRCPTEIGMAPRASRVPSGRNVRAHP